MATIIYFHGFASGGIGPKSKELFKAFPQHTVLAPDIPANPAAALKQLSALVHSATSFPVVFVGTSLGGFWANYLAHKFDVPCFLINPSIEPSVTMSVRVGKVFKNYQTGEPIEITKKDVRLFAKLEREAKELHNGALVSVFLAADDEVIDHKETINHLKFHKKLEVFNDGGHRFDKNFGEVVADVKKFLETEG